MYLDYEGPVSGDRGHVRKHDYGRCSILEMSADCWRFHFEGGKLRGAYEVRRGEDHTWRMRPAQQM
jgi:hypothetical protein